MSQHKQSPDSESESAEFVTCIFPTVRSKTVICRKKSRLRPLSNLILRIYPVYMFIYPEQSGPPPPHTIEERRWGRRRCRSGPYPSCQLLNMTLSLVLLFFVTPPPAPVVWPRVQPPFRPAPSLADPVLGLPCPLSMFRHHCNNHTADISIVSCFSVSCFYYHSRLLVYTLAVAF